jgi:hypothetical protein
MKSKDKEAEAVNERSERTVRSRRGRRGGGGAEAVGIRRHGRSRCRRCGASKAAGVAGGDAGCWAVGGEAGMARSQQHQGPRG